MNKKTMVVIGALLAVTIGAFGFSKFSGTESNAEAEVLETVVVKHESGETEVNKNPQRVVVFDYGILDSLDKLGVEGIIGVVKDNLPEHLSKFKADEYTSVGTLKEPNMEKIFELKPDLIIISGRQAEYYDELNKIAPTVGFSVDNEN